jgi:hypothetical protein
MQDYIQRHDVTSQDIPLEEAEVWEFDAAADKWNKQPCVIRAARAPLSMNEKKTVVKVFDVTYDRCVCVCDV